MGKDCIYWLIKELKQILSMKKKKPISQLLVISTALFKTCRLSLFYWHTAPSPPSPPPSISLLHTVLLLLLHCLWLILQFENACKFYTWGMKIWVGGAVLFCAEFYKYGTYVNYMAFCNIKLTEIAFFFWQQLLEDTFFFFFFFHGIE